MTTNETIDSLQEIIDRNQKTILPRVHVGYLIHAVKYLKEQKEEIENLKQTVQSMMEGICLLKEQEAVEPIPYHRSDGTIFKYECRQCRTKIFKMDLFCRHCGRSMKWK